MNDFVTDFNINYKKMTGKFYNAIIEGMEKQKVDFSYYYKPYKQEYVFKCRVYNAGAISIVKYNNIEAINLFSNISMEKYLEKYDDSKKDYFEKLKNCLDGLEIVYKMKNPDKQLFSQRKIGKYYSGTIYCDLTHSNKNSFFYDRIYYYKNFTFKNMITKEEYLAAVREIKDKFDLNERKTK